VKPAEIASVAVLGAVSLSVFAQAPVQSPMQIPMQTPAVPAQAASAASAVSAPQAAAMGAPAGAPPMQVRPMSVNPNPNPNPNMPQPAPLARAPAPPAPPTPPVAGLPPDAPKLVINGGIYSEDRNARAAIVNGNVVREGADLGSGVVLQEIRPSGVVLAFHGSRYNILY